MAVIVPAIVIVMMPVMVTARIRIVFQEWMATAASNDAKRVCCRVNNMHFFPGAGGMKNLALLFSDLKSK